MTDENKNKKSTKTYEEKLADLEKQAKKIAQQKRKLRAKKREEDQKVLINILTSEFNEKDPQKLKQKIDELKQGIDPNKQSNNDQENQKTIAKLQEQIKQLTEQKQKLENDYNQANDFATKVAEKLNAKNKHDVLTTLNIYANNYKNAKALEKDLQNAGFRAYDLVDARKHIRTLIDEHIANKHNH